MTELPPFVREAGFGPSVLCLHMSAASSSQWRPLMDHISASFRVLAADLYGEGRSPPWTSDRDCRIDDELNLLVPLLTAAAPCHLVGHSYGGAVALQMALACSKSVKSMVLYEPALWGLLLTTDPEDAGTKEILTVRQALLDHLNSGNETAAAQDFIDYWSGSGTWESTPENRRPALIQGVKATAKKWREAVGYPFEPQELQRIKVPLLLLTGTASPLAARLAATRLSRLVPHAELVELPELGHMGPITHPDLVNAEIGAFLARQC